MKNKIIAILMILVCIFLCWYIKKLIFPKKDTNDTNSDVYNIKNKNTYDEKLDTNNNNGDNPNDNNLDITNLDIIPQCFWGTWVMTEQWYGQDGWRECYDELQDVSIMFTPTSFKFENEYYEVSSYHSEFLAVLNREEYFHEAWKFCDLGIKGNYFISFYPVWDNLDDDVDPFGNYILISETELIIPIARTGMYKMKKVEEYTKTTNKEDCLLIGLNHSIFYGTWEITKQLGNPCQYVSIGDRLEIRKKKKLIDSCRVLNRKDKYVDKIAKRIGLNDNNNYLIYCRFVENHFWEYMLIQDGMNAIIVKGDYWYQVHRISDPEKDGIYNEL